jgi:hypothetical protein
VSGDVSEAEALAIRRRRERAKADYDEATTEAKVFVARGVEQGVSEPTLARWMCVDRMTVRKWLGKR